MDIVYNNETSVKKNTTIRGNRGCNAFVKLN